MCELVEEYAEKKAKRKKIEIAKNFINNTNLSLEEIAKSLGANFRNREFITNGY